MRIVLSLAFALIGLFPQALPIWAADDFRVRIVYDNKSAVPAAQGDWGFSCLVERGEDSILFDTGARTEILMRNFKSLGVDPASIDLVVLSHPHSDHIGGMEWILSLNPGIPVFVPGSAGAWYIGLIGRWGGQARVVTDPIELCEGIYVTRALPADFDPAFKEQSLLLRSARGPILITGCSHPGILAIVRDAATTAGESIRVLVGGFHLENKKQGELSSIIAGLKDVGIESCGAMHCSGEKAIASLEAAFDASFLDLGVGSTLVFPR